MGRSGGGRDVGDGSRPKSEDDDTGLRTNTGTSSSLRPYSSSYLHLPLLCASPALVDCRRALLSWSGRLRSSFMLSSKNPEHWLNMSLWSMYFRSCRPSLLFNRISTSPVTPKTGNSFCTALLPPPLPPCSDLPCLCLRTVDCDAREELATEGVRWVEEE